MQRVRRIERDLTIGGIAARADDRRPVDRTAVDGSSDEQRRARGAEGDRRIGGAGHNAIREDGSRAHRVRRRRVVTYALVEIIETRNVIELAHRADRLKLLTELALAQIGEAIAAECAICAGARRSQVDDRDAVRPTRIIVLLNIDSAPCGDRTKFDLGRDTPFQSVGEAKGLIDADLLRHPDISGAL